MDNEILDILKQIQTDIAQMRGDIKDLKDGQKRLEDGQNNIESNQIKLLDVSMAIDARQATSHLEILNGLNEIKSDIEFLGHKELQNEKEVFNIKKHLEIVK